MLEGSTDDMNWLVLSARSVQNFKASILDRYLLRYGRRGMASSRHKCMCGSTTLQ